MRCRPLITSGQDHCNVTASLPHIRYILDAPLVSKKITSGQMKMKLLKRFWTLFDHCAHVCLYFPPGAGRGLGHQKLQRDHSLQHGFRVVDPGHRCRVQAIPGTRERMYKEV